MDEATFNKLPLTQREALQKRLEKGGYYAGKIDGKWGAGTSAAFDLEKEAKVEKAERERKGKIAEKSAEAEAAEKKAAAKKTGAETKELERKTKAREERNKEAGTGWGIGTQIAANVLAPMAGTAAGMGLGKVTNYMMDKSQESRNRVLQGVAADRMAGRTTTEGAREGARLSGAMPLRNPALRTASRMAPHMGLGALSIGKGAQILSEENPDGPFYPEMANRAAGLGYIGAGAGLAKQGLRYGAAPGVAPDAKSLAIINSKQLRRNGIPGAPGASTALSEIDRGPLSSIDAESRTALPPPDERPEPKRGHAERLKGAARAGGATGIKTKVDAAAWLEGNLSDENRAAIARELGVKPGANFSKRISTAIKNMASKPGTSGLLAPLAGGMLAYSATPADAADGDSLTGQDEALTNAGIVTGLGAGAGYGLGKAAQALGPAGLKALGGAGSMLTPMMAADMTDDFASPEARNTAARYLPSWLRAGKVEDAFQMAQVPEKGERGLLGRRDLNAANLEIPPMAPVDDDRLIEEAMGIVRRARGGRISGGIHYAGGGRTDNVPMDVDQGSYIVPADVVSALGQGNTLAGIEVLDEMFPSSPQGRARGGKVPIIVAGGEYRVSPEVVAALGGGDLDTGANILDAFVTDTRQNHIDTLAQLPGPAQ